MFNTVLRVMLVDGVRWVETIPDTMYRSPSSRMIIVRSRGAHHNGRIIGKRFYCFIQQVDGSYRKMRGKKNTVRYFSSPLDAASEAALFYTQMQERWAKTRLLSELDELVVKARDLREEIEQLTKVRDTLKVGGETKQDAASKESNNDRSFTLMSEPGIAELPAFLKRSAVAVVSRYLN